MWPTSSERGAARPRHAPGHAGERSVCATEGPAGRMWCWLFVGRQQRHTARERRRWCHTYHLYWGARGALET